MRPATQLFAGWCVLTSLAYAQTIDLASSPGRWMLDGAVAGARAGAWIVAGDLTGDFWTRELIVGSPDENAARGAARLFLRRPSGSWTTASADVLLSGAVAGDRFGAAVDPGYVLQEEVEVVRGNPVGATPPRDVVVGAPGANGGRGAVYVFASPFSAGQTRTPANAAYTILGAVAGDNLGAVIETADLNGDRHREIVLAVPNRGIVYAIDLRASATTTIDLAAQVPGTVMTGLSTSIALAVGDVTGDMGFELAIGDSYAQNMRGVLYLVRARTTALPATLALPTEADAQLVGADVGDRFGAAVWVADIDDDDDPAGDLLVGAPGADGSGNARTDSGEVHVIWGRPDIAANFRSGLVLHGAAAGHRLGSLVTAGTITRKAPFDVVMLAPGSNGGAGEVFVYYGRHRFEFPSSASADLATAASRRLISDETAGPIVAVRAWEATGEGAEEIVIGVPSATAPAGAQAGRVFIPLSPRLDASIRTMTIRVARCVPGVQAFEITNPSVIAVPWRLYDAPSWIEIQPATGTSALGAPAPVKLVVRTSELAPGTYTQRVELLSNGPDLGQTVAIDIQLTVDPPAALAANADVDFGSDGCGDLATFTAGGVWHVPGEPDRQLGARGDMPVAGDYDGDLRAEPAVFRPSTGEWLFEGSVVQHGAPGDLPVPADYDGDGRMDIAVFTPSTATWWVRGQPPAQFGQPRDLPIPADYNGDGRAEFAVYRRRSGTWVISGAASVQWGSGTDVPVPADYDGDGSAEIAVFERSTGTWKIRGGATIQFGSAGDLPSPIDVDRDRRADLVLWRRITRNWLVRTATQLTMTVPGAGDSVAAWGRQYLILGSPVDFNGDGGADLVWQHTDGRIMLWNMNGRNRLGSATFNPDRIDPAWQMAGTADFNRDGQPDLLWRHADGRLAVWFMNGTTIFDGQYLTPDRLADANWRLLANGDLNGDGHTDLVWYHTDGTVAVWLMNGTRLVDGAAIARVEDSNWLLVGAGDADSDGKLDLYWQNRATGWLAVWIMDGVRLVDGRAIPLRLDDPAWSVAGVTDVNGDGYPDILWQHATQRYVAAWLLTGERLLDASMLNPTRMSDSNWRLAGPR